MNDGPHLNLTEMTTITETEVTAADLPETEVVKKPIHPNAASPTQVSSHTLDANEHTRGML